MLPQTQAIIWAQIRSLLHFYAKPGKSPFTFTMLFMVIWYAMFVVGAVLLARFAANPSGTDALRAVLPWALFAIVIYWQVIPIVLVSSGLALDLRRLSAYPVPRGQLFGMEVLLQFSVCLDILLPVLGLAVGTVLNPALPKWGALAFAPFILLNLFFSAGLKNLLARLLAYKRVREFLVIGTVLLVALPQVLVYSPAPEWLKDAAKEHAIAWLPSGVTASFAVGAVTPFVLFGLLAWLAAAYAFARWQFEVALRTDLSAVEAADRRPGFISHALARLARIPSALFRDPLAALVEKELRTLTRSARFRLVFLMGFTFGLLIFLPITMSGREAGGFFARNYLTTVTVYSLMLLGEVGFWNHLGFDRGAAQFYFVAPMPFSTVLVAKNISVAFFVLLELLLVIAVCAALRMPMTIADVAESVAVTIVLACFLLALGNIISVRNAKGVDPAQSFRNSSSGRAQAFLLIIYPLASLPIALAYGARFAFDSHLAFYGVLLLDLLIAGVIYWLALESAVTTAENRREELVAALSAGQGPIGG